MSLIGKIYGWSFVKIPKKFSVPLLFSLIGLNAFFYPKVMGAIDQFLSDDCSHPPISSLPRFISDRCVNLNRFFGGTALTYVILTVCSVVTIFLIISVSYMLAWCAFKLLRKRTPFKKSRLHPPKLPDLTPAKDSGKPDPFKKYHSIGIILAGGGAKGAYQAGAMKAIYDFLDNHKAHHKVKMIAGTSIGSWNALFWLAGLINNPKGGHGLLEEWWSHVSVEDVVAPVLYLPLQRNYLLSNQPWRETFNRFFLKNKKAYAQLLFHIQKPNDRGAIHFYFTRTNVAQARLEFVTNVADFKDIEDEYLFTSSLSELRRMQRLATSVEAIGTAVFSSMDLPPLFPYMTIDEDCYEDGGVIDNLPIRFGTDVEKCDLLFVLPLNASFSEDPDPHSIIRRVLRVMNVRQGVLERNSFKRVYRRNELIELRRELINLRNQAEESEKYEALFKQLKQQVEELNPQLGDALIPLKKILDETVLAHHPKSHRTNSQPKNELNRARVRKLIGHRHSKVQVFAICPAAKLAINTNEFWKTAEAGRAFRLMYQITTRELESFDFAADPDRIRIAHIDPYGEVVWSEDF